MIELPVEPSSQALVAAVHPPDWQNPTPRGRYNMVVIGGGSAGLVSAAATAGLGGKVALIERHWLGGDCLNTGCVPSKALIHGAKTGVEFAKAMRTVRDVRASIAPHDSAERFRDLGVDVYFGDAAFRDREHITVGDQTLRFARAVIASGGRAFVPPIPGLDTARYVTNETLFNLTEMPARVVVIGGGPIGCEMAQSLARFGCQVTVVDMAERILSKDDPDAAAIVRASLEADGVTFVLGTAIERVGEDNAVHAGGSVYPSDLIVLATGRRPNIENMGLEAAGIRTDKTGIMVDDRLRTTNKRVFAAGDCCSQFQFTHAADAMARIVVRNALFFGRARMSKLVIPWATYTDPEVAHVGMMGSGDVDTYEQPYTSVDRAITDGGAKGFVRVHTAKGKDRIVGATIVGPHAGELIGQMSHAMTHGQGLGSMAATIHPYPTLSLAIKQVGDQYGRTRLTPLVAGLFRRILKWRR